MKRVYISKIIQDNWRTELTCHSLQNFSIKHTHALSYGSMRTTFRSIKKLFTTTSIADLFLLLLKVLNR